jgi:hypothetical protein
MVPAYREVSISVVVLILTYTPMVILSNINIFGLKKT